MIRQHKRPHPLALVLLLCHVGNAAAFRSVTLLPRHVTTSTWTVLDAIKPHSKRKIAHDLTSFPKRVVRTYTDYATRLWNETNPDARTRISQEKAALVIRQVQHIFTGNQIIQVKSEDKSQLLLTCDRVLTQLARNQTAVVVKPTDSSTSDGTTAPPPKKKHRSILFGATMGLAVAGWVFSGNYIFTGLFTLMTILGQLEYYRMVQATGVYPARRISIIGACSMFLTALFLPDYHQICLPTFGLWAMIWFLTMRRTVTTIPEIATTFSGMFYLGYVPSFWVRIRLMGGGWEPTRLAPLVEPMLRFLGNTAEQRLPSFIPQAIHLPITTGAVFIFWTWLCLAFSDVGAYFVGKRFGRTKLGQVSPAAGATSPNKTVEGVIGGCMVSAVLSMVGAWVQKWPMWPLVGLFHGVMLGLLGLVGDLTASMLKRDANIKDFGDLLPEHGGVLDRVDSYIWAAPYSWVMCGTIIPLLKAWLR